MEEVIKILEGYATSHHRDFGYAFEAMLDFFIETFEVQRVMRHKCDYSSLFLEREKDDQQLFRLLEKWSSLTINGIKHNGSYDFFGNVYEEMVKGKFKSKSFGQFFTPMAVSDICAAITISPNQRSANDCACGSGRMLLSHWAKSDKTKFCYYVAQDLDPICVKMCALNFLMHGMIGVVVHQDTLEQNFLGAYAVNEIKYPFYNPACSIRRIDEKAYKTILRQLNLSTHRAAEDNAEPSRGIEDKKENMESDSINVSNHIGSLFAHE